MMTMQKMKMKNMRLMIKNVRMHHMTKNENFEEINKHEMMRMIKNKMRNIMKVMHMMQLKKHDGNQDNGKYEPDEI